MTAFADDQAPQDAAPEERRRYAMALRHKLAMESLGLVRTALNVQRPVFESLVNAEDALKAEGHDSRTHSRSFDLQLRMVRAALGFMATLDALANEALELAVKEKSAN